LLAGRELVKSAPLDEMHCTAPNIRPRATNAPERGIEW
jgi:hypothetical protein